jgi:thioredoxin 1
MADVVKVTDGEFEDQVIKSATPVLVDFYGTWCTPCQQLKPVLEEIAGEFAGSLKVVAAEVSEAPEAAARFDVMGVPTLVLVAGGEARDTLTGSPTKAEIVDAVKRHLA